MLSELDVAVRHQAYIEGVKNYEQDAMDPTQEALAVLLAMLLLRWGYERVSDMPKKILRDFTAQFNKQADKLLTAFDDKFIRELRTITRQDAKLTNKTLARLTGKEPVAIVDATMWSGITNDIIPATGHLPLQMMNDFTRSVKSQLALTIRRAYAEKWTVQETMLAINGTKARNFKDGLRSKIANQFNTVQQTLIQHIHQWIRFNISRLLYTHYRWVSVLDGNTTDICRSRNGNVYEYSNGPRPPAHYNCRSSIVGINGKMAYPTPPTYYAWMKDQPVSVQNDLLGQRRGIDLRAGRIKAEQLPRFDGTRKIAPDDLGSVETMLMTEE